MTKIKMCGLSSENDIQAANEIMPDYIGFVFAGKSKRFVSAEKAGRLKKILNPGISAVGVFVDESTETVAKLLKNGIIDIAQLHGNESDEYIRILRTLTNKLLFQAFRIRTADDVIKAEKSIADYVLLDAGAGDGIVFDWSLLKNIKRPFFLSFGLNCENAVSAVRTLHPFALDVSSGIETDGKKDKIKMAAFAAAVRKEDYR